MKIERASWRTQPWKNGRGITHEIWRTPDTGDYDVRISLAEDTEPAQFSLFPGYRRWSFLVGPAPIILAGETRISLVAPGDHVELPGDVALVSELPAGSTRLFNLLARVPIVAGFGPTGHPVRFTFSLLDSVAELHDPPIVANTAGCIWFAFVDARPRPT